jgi:hypothetical protein
MTRRWAITAISLATIGALPACGVAKDSPGENTRTVASAVVGGPHLLWQNRVSGQLEAWLLNGPQVDPNPLRLSQFCGGELLRVLDAGCVWQWQPVDTAQNSILWWNRGTGQLRTWIFDGSGNVTIPHDLTQTCGTGDGCLDSITHDWTPIGRVTLKWPSSTPCAVQGPCPDVNGLLWHDPISGVVRVWYFDSRDPQSVAGSFDLTQTCGSADGCSQNWAAKLTADFDGDGNTDILWWNARTGQLQEWLLSEAGVTTVPGMPPVLNDVAPKQIGVILSATCEASDGCSSEWRLVGAADVNGDGHVDLLWHNFQGSYPGAFLGTLRNWLLDGRGNVIGQWDLSQQCDCSPQSVALGYVFFPQPI